MRTRTPAQSDGSPAARARTLFSLVAGLLLVGSGIAQPPRAHADVIIFVDTASDVIANDGFCSLREAITAANNNGNYFGCIGNGGGYDLIELSIGAGTPVINVATALPIITGPVEINGGPNRVELRGPGFGSGLAIEGSGTAGSVIRGLVINGFAQGISVQSTSNITIAANRIGTNAAGTAAVANQWGIRIQASTNTQVGGTSGVSPGASCTGDCNLISGNTSRGIYVENSSATIRGNLIGTNAGGAVAIGNGTGVRSEPGSSITVGGTTTAAGNVIAGNFNDGISINQGAATIQGNSIGTNAPGLAALPNSTGVRVDLANGSYAVNIGGAAAGAGNLISGNVGPGIVLLQADDVLIYGNRIGTQANGTSPLRNGGAGVQLSSSTHDNSIGGTSAGQANVIAYNGTGVTVGVNNYDNSVRGNSIRDNLGKGIALADYQSDTAFAPLINGVSPVTGSACPGCVVHVYSDAADEGATYHGNTAADGAGNWSYNGTVAGPFVTATATNAKGGTSEFSAAYPTTPPPDTDGDGVLDAADNCTLLANPTQCDSDGDGFGNRCDGDLNDNGFTNAQDTVLFRAQLGTPSVAPAFNEADLNCNGFVNAQDTTIFRTLLGIPPGPQGELP